MKKLIIIAITIISSVLIFYACSEERDHANPFDPDYWDSDKTPSNISVTYLSLTSARISWTDNSIEEQFIIDRKLSSSTTWERIGEVTGDKSTGVTKAYTDNSQTTGSTYNYRVYAVYSEVTSNVIESPYYSATLPAPSYLSATVVSETSINLNWSDNSTDEEGFIIDRKIGASETWTANYATVNANITTYTDMGLNTGTTYHYRIRAYSASYFSNYSNDVEMNCLLFIEIPAGSFSMGQTDVETPVHTVNITRPYYLGKYEVTQKEWTDITGSNPASNNSVGDNYPVYSVNWYSTLVYCNKRSISEGLTPCYTILGSTDPDSWGTVPSFADTTGTYIWSKVICDFKAQGYRLPTEAEWEYAARYNDSRTYPWGETVPSNTLCNYNLNVGYTTAVGSYPSGNSNLELCDMAGNVWEWVWDWDAAYPSSTQTDPTGGTIAQSYRVSRGGGYSPYNTTGIRCANRSRNQPLVILDYYGFRLARTK